MALLPSGVKLGILHQEYEPPDGSPDAIRVMVSSILMAEGPDRVTVQSQPKANGAFAKAHKNIVQKINLIKILIL